MMNFGPDIFPEAVVHVYVVSKRDDNGTRIGDDINEKRKPDLAYRKKCMYSKAYIYTHPTVKNTTTES